MTIQEIIQAYRRNGKFVRAVAKDVAKQLRAGTLTSSDFVGHVPFHALEDAYHRFGDRFPLRYAAWKGNMLAALKKRELGKQLPAQGQSHAVALPVGKVKLDVGQVEPPIDPAGVTGAVGT